MYRRLFAKTIPNIMSRDRTKRIDRNDYTLFNHQFLQIRHVTWSKSNHFIYNKNSPKLKVQTMSPKLKCRKKDQKHSMYNMSGKIILGEQNHNLGRCQTQLKMASSVRWIGQACLIEIPLPRCLELWSCDVMKSGEFHHWIDLARYNPLLGYHIPGMLHIFNLSRLRIQRLIFL